MNHKANQVIVEKEITEELVQEIWELEKVSFKPELQWSEEDLREALHAPDAITVVAYDERGHVAGSLLLSDFGKEFEELKNEADPEIEHIPDALHIYSIAVRPDMQGKGIFSKLVKKFRETHPDKTVTLHASTANNCSAGMQKHGARLVRRVPNWYGSGETFDYLIFDPIKK